MLLKESYWLGIQVGIKMFTPIKNPFFLGKGHTSLSVSILLKSLKITRLIKHYLFRLQAQIMMSKNTL